MSAPKLCVRARARLLALARGRAPVHALPRLAATHAVCAVRAPATASNDAVLLMHVVVALAPLWARPLDRAPWPLLILDVPC